MKEEASLRAGEKGYVLALLLAICTVLGIHLMKAIPAAHAEVQREMEAELIYRGEHLANAIEAYRQRAGTYPTSMDQLVKVRPRLARKLYTDPMTRDGAWDLVYNTPIAKDGSTEGLPISGVRSKSQKDSFRMYRNKTLYSDWIFTANNNALGLGSQQPQRGVQAPPATPPPPPPPGNP